MPHIKPRLASGFGVLLQLKKSRRLRLLCPRPEEIKTVPLQTKPGVGKFRYLDLRCTRDSTSQAKSLPNQARHDGQRLRARAELFLDDFDEARADRIAAVLAGRLDHHAHAPPAGPPGR